MDANQIGTDALFRKNWISIITEVGERYGSRLAGSFIDEGWYPSPFEEQNRALKAGYSMIETANTASRGISEGVWGSEGNNDVAALYWFYRYNADGSFASRASVTDKIVLCSNGQFTSIWHGRRL
jgi:hypothetical protein